MARQAGGRAVPPEPALVLHVDLSRPVPPYEQIREQLAGLVAAGSLPAGRRLPSVRQLAGDLGLAPGTVARAYATLEADGVLRTRERGGTFVAGPAQTASSARLRALAAAADRYVTAARELGLGDDAAQAAVREAIARTAGA